MVDSNTSSLQDKTYVFCFGSNGPRQLSDRVGTPLDNLLQRTIPVHLRGWKRGFCGYAWEGTSAATIFETQGASDFVEGIAVAMTQREIESLDPYEGYPYVYDRLPVTLTAFVGSNQMSDRVKGRVQEKTVDGIAYVRVQENEDFVQPCDAYVKACCKTVYKCRQLISGLGQ